MTSEQPQNPELPLHPQVSSYWLLGFLHGTGTIGFDNHNKLYLVISGEQDTLHVLKDKLGLINAKTYPPKGKSNAILKIGQHEAKNLLGFLLADTSIPTDLPYMQLIKAAHSAALQGDTINLNPYKDRLKSTDQENNAPNPYDQLLQSPHFIEFFAGLLDSHRSFRVTAQSQDPSVYIQNRNRLLIAALAKHLHTQAPKEDKDPVITFTNNPARRIIQQVEHHLVLRREEAQRVLTDSKESKKSILRKQQAAFAQEHAAFLQGLIERGSSVIVQQVIGRNGAPVVRISLKMTGNPQKIAQLAEFLHIFNPVVNKPVLRENANTPVCSFTIWDGSVLPIIHVLGNRGNRHPQMHIVKALSNWDNLTREQKLAIYQNEKDSPNAEPVNASYPVSDIRFVAGILANYSGSIGTYLDTDTGNRYPIIRLALADRRLIEALQNEYRGTVHMQKPEGTDNPIYIWQLRGEDLWKFYAQIKDHLVVNKELAKELLEWSTSERIEQHILTILSQESVTPQALRSRINAFVDSSEEVTRRISAQGIQDILQSLLASGRISESEGRYEFSFDHPDNLSVIERSPRALAKFLTRVLKDKRLLVLSAATGQIIGIQQPDKTMFWHRRPELKEQMTRLIKYYEQELALQGFIQKSVGGVINCISNAAYMNVESRNALKETIVMALLEAYSEASESLLSDTLDPFFDFDREAERIIANN